MAPPENHSQITLKILTGSPKKKEPLISPASGAPIAIPSQDIVLGIYYMTVDRENDKGEFSIPTKGLENGTYTLEIWHEKLAGEPFSAWLERVA